MPPPRALFEQCWTVRTVNEKRSFEALLCAQSAKILLTVGYSDCSASWAVARRQPMTSCHCGTPVRGMALRVSWLFYRDIQRV